MPRLIRLRSHHIITNLCCLYILVQTIRLHWFLQTYKPIQKPLMNNNLLLLKNFDYVKQEPNHILNSIVCRKHRTNSEDLSILLAIFSRPEKILLRQAIRRTWATYFSNDQKVIKSALFFVIGRKAIQDKQITIDLNSEINTHNDFLVLDIFEDYHVLRHSNVLAKNVIKKYVTCWLILPK